MALSTLLLLPAAFALAAPPVDKNLQPCGDAYYLTTHYTCYDGNFLCPVENGEPLLRCGPACYKPQMYSCDAAGNLIYPPVSGSGPSTASSSPGTTTTSVSVSASSSIIPAVCTETPTTQQLSAPPYIVSIDPAAIFQQESDATLQNYFLSDCHSASQIVVTSPLPDSNLTIIGPRLVVAWPAGNSGTSLMSRRLPQRLRHVLTLMPFVL